MDIRSLISRSRTHYKNRSHRQKIILTLVLLFLGLATLIILLKGCQSKANVAHAPLLIRENNTIRVPENSPLRKELTIQAVKTSKAPHIIILPGIVEADPSRAVNILPPLAGLLTAINVKLGDDVKQNQVLAVIQSAGLAQANADESKARSLLKQTADALGRAQKVNRAGANAVKDIEQAQNNYAQALAESQRTQTTLQSLGNNKNNLIQIKAPLDGKITAQNYGLGSFINDPTTSLFTLSNIQSVWVTACVPENIIASVAKEQSVQVFLNAYPQQSWRGKITFINNLIDPATRCNQTRIAFINPDEKLQPNMFARIHTQIPQPEQIIVPLSAILMNNDTTSVFMEITPWVFQQRAVVLGSEDGDSVRITSGLKAGDRIVAAGGILVND